MIGAAHDPDKRPLLAGEAKDDQSLHPGSHPKGSLQQVLLHGSVRDRGDDHAGALTADAMIPGIVAPCPIQRLIVVWTTQADDSEGWKSNAAWLEGKKLITSLDEYEKQRDSTIRLRRAQTQSYLDTTFKDDTSAVGRLWSNPGLRHEILTRIDKCITAFKDEEDELLAMMGVDPTSELGLQSPLTTSSNGVSSDVLSLRVQVDVVMCNDCGLHDSECCDSLRAGARHHTSIDIWTSGHDLAQTISAVGVLQASTTPLERFRNAAILAVSLCIAPSLVTPRRCQGVQRTASLCGRWAGVLFGLACRVQYRGTSTTSC
eukprot:1754867-Rhodomonas_salina.1